jgi:mannitol-specific phosphotransferase system IIBC component
MPYEVPDDEYGEWFGHALVRQIPEPSTFIIWSLLGALGITVGWWRRRRSAD